MGNGLCTDGQAPYVCFVNWKTVLAMRSMVPVSYPNLREKSRAPPTITKVGVDLVFEIRRSVRGIALSPGNQSIDYRFV